MAASLTGFVTAEARQYLSDADAPTPKADYSQVREALFEVRSTAQQVFDEDLRQSQQAVADIAREYPVMNTLIGYLVAEAERSIRADVQAAIDELQQVADERLSPHSHVPQRLETQRDEAADKARQLGELVEPARELTVTEGWLGEAAAAYQEQAGGQVVAFEEFATLNERAAQCLDQAALLHRATFYFCAASLRISATKIALLQSADPGHLFARTRQAIALLTSATSQLTRDVDSFQRGTPAQELADGMESLLGGTEVLTGATWPKSGDE